jgi:uncharacterized RDD family membrane protein YckC
MNNFEYAGFRLRLAAFIFDYIIIAGYVLVTAAVGLALLITMGPFTQMNPLLIDIIPFVVMVLPVSLYTAWQESSPYQATWGKRKKGLRVVTAAGARLSLSKALARSLVKFLPWQLAHISIPRLLWVENPPMWVTVNLVVVWLLVAVYLAFLWLTKTHRTPYDWLAGSMVIVSPPGKRFIESCHIKHIFRPAHPVQRPPGNHQRPRPRQFCIRRIKPPF